MHERENEEEFDGYQEDPIHPPPPPLSSTAFPTSQPGLGSLAKTAVPQSNTVRDIPTGRENENKQESAFFEEIPATQSGQEGPPVSSDQPRLSEVYIPSQRPSSVRVPPAPTTYFPHVYQPPPRHQPEREADTTVNNDISAPGFPQDPLPSHFPPYFHHSHPHLPPRPHYRNSPWAPPTLNMGGQNASFSHFSPGFNIGPPAPYFTANSAPFRLSWPPPPPPHLSGFSPAYPGPSIYDSSATGLNSSGHHMFGSPGYPPIYFGGGGYSPAVASGRTGRGRSPSGVTGISMQVQPPSSPPSAPSPTNLPHASSDGQNTGQSSYHDSLAALCSKVVNLQILLAALVQ